ncbi:YigZ family protein [Salinisphaera sp. T31B1]|uniref:IMPACT family protein n=1 Tax=Salinisphaera sp. T31B1 TaxID=727963 RepID=UPI00333FBFDC
MRYPVPAASIDHPHVATLEVQKSRFIGWCASVDDAEQAQQLLTRARRRYPDASHHCSAFIAGAPGEDQAIGFADDGEPGGTAGRPMYQVLHGSGIGRIACVVIRYFGGIKLGTGGLARAYGQTVSEMLATLPRRQYIPRARRSLALTFADEQPARAWLAAHDGTIVDAAYHARGVTLAVDWPLDAGVELAELNTRLEGRIRIVGDDMHRPMSDGEAS